MKPSTTPRDPWWKGETRVFVSDCPNHSPRTSTGRKIHVATFYRWAQSGLRGYRLRVFQLGGRMATTLEELDRFFFAITEAANERATCLSGEDEEALRRKKLL